MKRRDLIKLLEKTVGLSSGQAESMMSIPLGMKGRSWSGTEKFQKHLHRLLSGGGG